MNKFIRTEWNVSYWKARRRGIQRGKWVRTECVNCGGYVQCATDKFVRRRRFVWDIVDDLTRIEEFEREHQCPKQS